MIKHLFSLPVMLVLVALGLFLMFVFWEASAQWAWVGLGFAWAPAIVWPLAFMLVMRYRTIWLGVYWRDWVGAAFFSLGAIGLLSLFTIDRWWLEDATLGGHWGTVLGGAPFAQKSLGILKVVVLFAVVPPIISPRLAGGIYKEAAKKSYFALRGTFLWILHTAIPATVRAIRSVPKPSRIWLRFKVTRRNVARSLFGGHEEEEPVPAVAPPPEIEGEDLDPVKTAVVASAHSNGKASPKIFGWHLPTFDLLAKPEAVTQQAPPNDLSEQIVSTLSEHGIDVSIRNVKVGPRVIQFGLEPGWVSKGRDSRVRAQGGLPTSDSVRVKVQSILAREKDLALAMRTPHIRIEAPIPGEAAVGIELPNPTPSKVPIRAVLESSKFRKLAEKGGLPIALGADTAGEPVAVDLKSLPHLLIAGATGSGKSVCINTVITSMLLTNTPERLRLLMVDPKRVELTPFNGIPHLIAPVITDANEVLSALKSLVAEMFRRYQLMEELGVRNIEGYNRKASEKMPFLVLVIDELADMMMVAAYESEQAAVRLAQLGRATGVHLVLATQRPSVNVVTGLIKANIPARAAFAVASQVDSRVVLDAVGAERLLGKGDMLFLSQDAPKPRRVQGTLVDDEEIEALVDFWKEQKGPPLPSIMPNNWEGEVNTDAIPSVDDYDDDDDEADELLDRARELSLELPRLSPSVLQRRLSIGYSKAVELIQTLEKEGRTAARVG
jgi:DNA segregation ATPase FtsK/SpoIIIE-like protein